MGEIFLWVAMLVIEAAIGAWLIVSVIRGDRGMGHFVGAVLFVAIYVAAGLIRDKQERNRKE